MKVEKLTETIGAQVESVDIEQLLFDDTVPDEVLAALDANGVLIFPGMHLDDDTQVRFCKRLAPVLAPEISVISLDPAKAPNAEYLKGTFDWHIDGTKDAVPHMAAVTTAKVIASRGGESEFASTYAAYDDLTDGEKDRLMGLRVLHDLGAQQRRLHPNPTPEQEAGWKGAGKREQPLVWRHQSDRRSLVVGATADHIVGWDYDEGRALLDDLLDAATRSERVYRHAWSVGDLVIWDNRGVLHRASPYDETSPRELHRTHLEGNEPIQ